ncbi:hypothetical protein HDV04_001497 [Boothiomyces sp. JEL0838]|nr:hypothetical protein HDV04_001497 [Boothiomyces sp. JEL0838]
MLEWYPEAVSEEALNGLKKYKYSAIDLSPISRPNLITLLGFVFVLFNFFLLLVYTPDLYTPGPSWIYFSFGIGLWLYSTFDNVDGKQARRTGSSSPLGELFDHGVDALNCTTGALLNAAGLCLGLGDWSLLSVGIAATAFFFSTWETYYTGTLFLGYINGPTEGLLISISSLFISGIFGPQVWTTPVSQVLPFLKPLLGELSFAHFAVGNMLLLLIFTQIPVSILRVIEVCGKKNISVTSALFTTVPYLVMASSAFFWATAGTHVAPDNTIVFALAWGFAIGRINALIILNHVTHIEYPSYNFLVVPFAFGAFVARAPQLFGIAPIFNAHTESVYIWITFLFITIEYILWAVKVVEQFCDHLNIKCFTIPYKHLLKSASPVRGRLED